MSEYLKATGISYRGTLPKIKRKDDFLQPIFEAFTNALESIKLLKSETQDKKVSINIYLNKDLDNNAENNYFDFLKIEIKDTGIGFNDKEFKRLTELNNSEKGFNNKGSGRVQFIHAFDMTEVSSVYKDTSSTGFKKRIFTLSKSENFLSQNAIIRLEDDNKDESEASKSSTIVTFKGILIPKNEQHFKSLTAEELKRNIIKHYLVYFCENRSNLPEITIKRFIDDELEYELSVNNDDIPNVDQEKDITVKYSIINKDNNIDNTSDTENFNIKAFKINEGDLQENELRLVSKGENAKEITLENLLKTDQINNKRYLFLLSGKYIDDRDNDTRGEIRILNKKKFIEQADLFSDKEILLEDIESKANNAILTMYKEIKQKKEEKRQNIEELKKMFLLNDKTIESLSNKIGVNYSDNDILQRVYKAEVEIIAKQDAEIKQQVESLDALDPSQKDYQSSLMSQVDEFVKIIPLQNRTALTQYVARRKLVLDVFGKILNKEISKLRDGGRIDEKLIHNLIFQQSSDSTETSDLWLINEEFIYFKGVSEFSLDKLEANEEKIFNKNFNQEEERYLNSLNENRLKKRPDILLFPQEGKCIILEFKAPNVNVSEHLSQIDFYANLIRNYTNDKFQITAFYGYLIGESIEDRDVRGRVSRFEHSYNLDYWFRPSENVIGFDDRSDGSIYTEVIKYSTLLERAKIRNKMFIDKITKSTNKNI